MPKSEPQPLGSLLGRVLQELGLKEKLRQYDVVTAWPDLVGERIAKVTKAYRIDRGVLFVRVETSEWRNELVMRKPEILKKINTGEQIVTDIVFR